MKRAKKDATKEELKRSEKQIEDVTAKAIAAVDSAIKAKEKELLTV
jgi:ribosome recycling factor